VAFITQTMIHKIEGENEEEETSKEMKKDFQLRTNK
jgi:hypothetical protein